jgi:hypothetical protein
MLYKVILEKQDCCHVCLFHWTQDDHVEQNYAKCNRSCQVLILMLRLHFAFIFIPFISSHILECVGLQKHGFIIGLSLA